MKWVVGFLWLSNVALWYALNKSMEAIKEWMEAMKDAHDEHQHVKRYGLDMVELSGKPASTFVAEETR